MSPSKLMIEALTVGIIYEVEIPLIDTIWGALIFSGDKESAAQRMSGLLDELDEGTHWPI